MVRLLFCKTSFLKYFHLNGSPIWMVKKKRKKKKTEQSMADMIGSNIKEKFFTFGYDNLLQKKIMRSPPIFYLDLFLYF